MIEMRFVLVDLNYLSPFLSVYSLSCTFLDDGQLFGARIKHLVVPKVGTKIQGLLAV